MFTALSSMVATRITWGGGGDLNRPQLQPTNTTAGVEEAALLVPEDKWRPNRPLSTVMMDSRTTVCIDYRLRLMAHNSLWAVWKSCTSDPWPLEPQPTHMLHVHSTWPSRAPSNHDSTIPPAVQTIEIPSCTSEKHKVVASYMTANIHEGHS